MIVGLVVNWGVSLFVVYGEDEGLAIDPMDFFLTIPTWPITLYGIVQALIRKD